MEGKTNFSRRLKQFDKLTWLTLTSSYVNDRSTPLSYNIAVAVAPDRLQTQYMTVHSLDIQLEMLPPTRSFMTDLWTM